jgi:hypothetical protein
VSWVTGVLIVVAVDVVSLRSYGAAFLPDRFWVAGLLLLAPLLGAASVLATMRLSARMTDPQAAMQVSGLAVMPIFLTCAALAGKLITISFTALLLACVPVAILDLLLFRQNVRKFRREEILTRWK